MTGLSLILTTFRRFVVLLFVAGTFVVLALGAGHGLPTAGQIAYLTWNDRYQVMLSDIATSLRHELTRQLAVPCCLSYSPDGQHLAYITSANDGPPRIMVMSWQGGDAHPVVADYVSGLRPIWTPDSSEVAFRRPYTQPAAVAAKIKGVGLRDTALLPDQNLPPQWSPDGQFISIALTHAIYIAQADCLAQSANCATADFTEIPAQDLVGFPVWSPDSQRLAFSLYHNNQTDLFTVRADGEDLRQLTNDTADDQQPAWSPDGRYLAFNSNRDGQWAVYRVGVDGNNLQRLSQTTVNTFLYANPWSPDGKAILFYTDRDPAASNSRSMAIYVADLAGNQRKVVDGLFFAPSPTWWTGVTSG
ncbi:MAG: hypothetical protein R3E39_31015 [Anaerolineae bacterium]